MEGSLYDNLLKATNNVDDITTEKYSVITKLEKMFDYVYDTSVDEETDEITESKCDVILVELSVPGLKEQTEKNTSDIEYIAIMSDIEL